MGVYGIALAGWSSNNKYALLGGLRSSAQMISYELPMSLAIASPLLTAGSLQLRGIADSQAGFYLGVIPKWAIFQMPAPQFFAFIIFMIAAFAETNRIPFDLPEAENELVAGFHVEYSSMTFASFFMAEYANMVTVCSVATLLFLGGWQPLWPAALGSDFVAPAIFAGAGGDLPLSRSEPRASLRPLYPPGIRGSVLRPRRTDGLSAPGAGADAAVLVPGQGGLPSLRIHLDSRNAAPLPV